MEINGKETKIEDVIKFSQHDNLILRRRENSLILSDYQVNILKRYDIDYMNYNNMRELLFDIEEILNTNFDQELDLVSNQIQEFIYYNETNK